MITILLSHLGHIQDKKDNYKFVGRNFFRPGERLNYLFPYSNTKLENIIKEYLAGKSQ